MTLNERRAHWKIGQAEPEWSEEGVPLVDPSAERYGCFTLSEHAAEWLAEQLAERTVADLGGFDSAADWYDWVRRQAGRDEDADAEQLHASDGGAYQRIAATIGGIEYRMEVCTCIGEVTGRCHNTGCDRDTDWDSEPDGGRYPGYTKWGTDCYRCHYPERANGGFTGRDPKPIPAHHHEGEGRVAKLIEYDKWVGWRCCEGGENDTGCGKVWHFGFADMWASQYRLTRMWDGKVTGTEGYTRTEAEAEYISEQRTRESVLHNRGFTVGYEKIQKEQQ